MREAMQSSRSIGVAVGIMMSRDGVNERRAFGMLRQVSMDEQVQDLGPG
ncbi:ANTAR domain-containing protein [Phycicoccus mangrovi]|nr:ANTAR domain-containing protein [Phycicoccus mangrovi]